MSIDNSSSPSSQSFIVIVNAFFTFIFIVFTSFLVIIIAVCIFMVLNLAIIYILATIITIMAKTNIVAVVVNIVVADIVLLLIRMLDQAISNVHSHPTYPRRIVAKRWEKNFVVLVAKCCEKRRRVI